MGPKLSVEDRVIRAASYITGSDVEDISPSKDLMVDLGMDSLDVVEFNMKVEEEFDLEIPDGDAEKIRTVQEMVDYLNAKGE